MTKKLLLIISLLSTLSLFSQNKKVNGVVFGEEKSLKDVTVINYTKLNFFEKASKFSSKKWNINSSKTNSLGHFSLENTNLNDTLLFSVCNYIPQKITVKDFKKARAIQLTKEDCAKKAICSDPVELNIFIGEKISIDRATQKNCCGIISLDQKFSAKYKVLEMLEGDFSKPTIDFTIFDHNGEPAFSEKGIVLLYVIKKCDALIHIKYQYAEVYKTKDQRWAVPYKANDYKKPQTSIKPEIIEFESAVKYNIKTKSKEYVALNYPEPFYKIEGDFAIAIYGNFVEDIIKLKKPSVLANL